MSHILTSDSKNWDKLQYCITTVVCPGFVFESDVRTIIMQIGKNSWYLEIRNKLKKAFCYQKLF